MIAHRPSSTAREPRRPEEATRMLEGPVPGRSIVTRRAIVDIVRTAVQGSYGVVGLSDPDLRSRLLRWLGLRPSGIRLTVATGLDLDLYVTVAYGVPVAEVARQVDSAVRYALRRALGREVGRLTVHVGGLHYQAGGGTAAGAAVAPQPADAAPVIGAEPVPGDGHGRPVAAESGGRRRSGRSAGRPAAGGPEDAPR